MDKQSRVYVAGHRGMVGAAIRRRLEEDGHNLILRTSAELDLRDKAATDAFFEAERPDYVFIAAAKVGGILANDTQGGDFIRDNLAIQTNVIDAAYRSGAQKLLFLGATNDIFSSRGDDAAIAKVAPFPFLTGVVGINEEDSENTEKNLSSKPALLEITNCQIKRF